MSRTRDLPIFPLTPDPVRSDVSPDFAPVRRELVAAGSPDAVARTVAQAHEVDGVTNLIAPEGIEPGSMIEVEIVDAFDYNLVAKITDR